MSEPNTDRTRDHQTLLHPIVVPSDRTIRACVAAVREARHVGIPVGECVCSLLDHVNWSELRAGELEIVLALVVGAQDRATKRQIRVSALLEHAIALEVIALAKGAL